RAGTTPWVEGCSTLPTRMRSRAAGRGVTWPPASRSTGPAWSSSAPEHFAPSGGFLRLCPGSTLPTMRPALSTKAAVRRSLFLLTLPSLACQRPRHHAPAAAYRSFLTAVRKERNDRVLELLSADTRQALVARAKALSADSGGSLSSDPVALLLGSLH